MRRPRSTLVYFLAHREDHEFCVRIRDKLHPVVYKSPLGVELVDHWETPVGDAIAHHQERLRDAAVVVLVMSSRILSDASVSGAYQEVVDLYSKKRIRVVVVQARTFMWRLTPFRDEPVLPDRTVALVKLDEGKQDEAFLNIARAITVTIKFQKEEEEGQLLSTLRSGTRIGRNPPVQRTFVADPPPPPFDFLATEPPRNSDGQP